MKEKITAAAIQWQGRIYTGWHHKGIREGLLRQRPMQGYHCGFVTTKRPFVSREVGAKIAVAAGQALAVDIEDGKLHSHNITSFAEGVL